MSRSQIQALQEYICTLERQNAAKSIEQQTLYRELESLTAEVNNMEKYYHQVRDYRQQVMELQEIIAMHEQDREANQARGQDCQQLIAFNQDLKYKLDNCHAQIEELHMTAQQKDKQIAELHEQLVQSEREKTKLQESRKQSASRLQAAQEESVQLQALLREREEEVAQLRGKVSELSRQDLSINIQEVVRNYERIAEVVLEKQENIRELETYINQLEQQCQVLNEEFIRADKRAKDLQDEVAVLRMRRNQENSSEDNLSFLTDSISKIDLIRQNNKMLETITRIENGGREERSALSECGQGRLNSSRSKLQMRIQTLKMQNQNLLRTLAI